MVLVQLVRRIIFFIVVMIFFYDIGEYFVLDIKDVLRNWNGQFWL